MRSYASGPSAKQLSGDTIGECLAATADKVPTGLALISRHQGVRLTWQDLADQTDALALGLMGMGMEVGDRVGIWAPTCVEWTLLQLAAARVGAILVNVNPAYRSTELEYALRQSGVRLLVTPPRFKTSEYLAMIAEVRPTLRTLESVVVIGTERTVDANDLLFEELVAGVLAGDPARLAARGASLDADDPINIQYTSGTTGNPKGATLTHHNILNNARSIAELLGYTEADRVCIPVPLYHCFGMGIGSLGCVASGATMVYPAPSFEPDSTLDPRRDRRRALHKRLRRPDDVHRHAGITSVRGSRSEQSPHRDHGRSPVSGRSDEAGGQRDARRGDDDRLRHDRDFASVDHDPS